MQLTTFQKIRASVPTAEFISSIAAFILLLGLGLGTLADLFDGPEDARTEAAATVPTPVFPTTLAEVLRYPSNARVYLKERWIFKDQLVRLHTLLNLKLFKPLSATTGDGSRDGWMFIQTDVAINGYIGRPTLTKDQVAAWDLYFETLRREMAVRGIDYAFGLVPSKPSTYPEFLPAWLSGLHVDVRRQDQIFAAAMRQLDPAPVDIYALFDTYRAENPDNLLFFSTDTHWNERGAVVATVAMLESLGLEMPVPTLPLVDTQKGGDLARMAGVAGDMREIIPTTPRDATVICRDENGATIDLLTFDPYWLDEVRCTSDSGRDQRLLVLMDSFGVAAQPYLAQTFAETIFIRIEELDFALIDDIGPDIVLQYFAERKSIVFDPAQTVATARY